MSLKPAAILTIQAPGAMTAAGRRAIAKWLAKQAAALVADGKNYTPRRFTARYLYEEKPMRRA